MKKILVIDDSRTARTKVEIALRDEDRVIVHANEGQQALDLLAEHPDVAVMITDINMPNMDGLTLVEHLRMDPRTALIPVVIVSAETDPRLMERAKKTKVRAWMVKPFKDDKLRELIRRIID